MQLTIITKNYGTQHINTDTFAPMMASAGSTIFKAIEHIFNDWYESRTKPGCAMARDIVGMYNGDGDQPAIYHKSGAIRGGIETFIEIAEENKSKNIYNSRDLNMLDIESAFE